MEEETYLNDRLDDQITWYGKRSGDYQRLFKRLRIWQILCASAIPFVAGYADNHLVLQISAGLLGMVVAALSALDGLLKPQQLWLEYRTTAETLKHQKFLYLTKTAPYDGDNAFNQLVENVENTISKENSRWAQQMSKKEKTPAAGRQ